MTTEVLLSLGITMFALVVGYLVGYLMWRSREVGRQHRRLAATSIRPCEHGGTCCCTAPVGIVNTAWPGCYHYNLCRCDWPDKESTGPLSPRAADAARSPHHPNDLPGGAR